MNKLLIAFTAGAVLGILYAPAKGRKTRNKLSNLGNDLMNGWNTVTDKIAGKIDSIKEGVDEMSDKAIQKVESTQFSTGNTLL